VLEEARGQRQSAFRWALLVFEPAAKGVMIDTNSGGYDGLALVRLSHMTIVVVDRPMILVVALQ
jgi:hypothetical protein